MSVDRSRAELTVTAEVDGVSGVRLVAVGEIDLSTADRLRAELDAALDRSAQAIVVDLAGVSFMDSTGIAVLVHARNRAVADGATVSVIDPQPTVRRILTVTGLLKALTDED
jgi:anti-anti-sigma factor